MQIHEDAGPRGLGRWRTLALLALGFMGWAASSPARSADAAPTPPALPALGADASQTSVSGLSSGAFMAVQLQVAFSKTVVGAGVVAGGPYYCAANNPLFVTTCMAMPFTLPLNPSLMVEAARVFDRQGHIDPLSTLAKRRLYVFSGQDDAVVRTRAVDAAVEFFRQAGVPAGNIRYDKQLPAGHALITPDQGNDCAANAPPYISHCSLNGRGYDQAGELLGQILGPLSPRATKPAGRLLPFDQRPFATRMPGALAPTGFVYVPPVCEAGAAKPGKGAEVGAGRCRVHVALHGCGQSAQTVGLRFTTQAGYNTWADSNRLLILYPQVDKSSASPTNPAGCWDWWGYTGPDYAWRSGVQMKAIMDMVNRLGEAGR